MHRLTLAFAAFSFSVGDTPAGDPPIKELGTDGYAEGVIYNVDVKGGYFDLRTADGPVRARRQYAPIVFKKDVDSSTPMTLEDVAALTGIQVAVSVRESQMYLWVRDVTK